MNSNQVAIIKRALTEIKLLEIKKFEDLPNIDAKYSDKYNKNISALIQKQKHMSIKNRIAIVIIAAVLIVTFAVPAFAYEKQIREFFIDIGENFTRLFSEDKKSGTVERIYYATWLPDGYEQVELNNYEIAVTTVWASDNNKIILEQLATGSTSIRLDTENTYYQVTQIGSKTIHYAIKNDTYSITWIEEHYTFTLSCHNSIHWEDVKRIITSLYPL